MTTTKIVRCEHEGEKRPDIIRKIDAIECWVYTTDHYDLLWFLFKTIVDRIADMAPATMKNLHKRNMVKAYVYGMVRELKAEDGDQFNTVY